MLLLYVVELSTSRQLSGGRKRWEEILPCVLCGIVIVPCKLCVPSETLIIDHCRVERQKALPCLVSPAAEWAVAWLCSCPASVTVIPLLSPASCLTALPSSCHRANCLAFPGFWCTVFQCSSPFPQVGLAHMLHWGGSFLFICFC